MRTRLGVERAEPERLGSIEIAPPRVDPGQVADRRGHMAVERTEFAPEDGQRLAVKLLGAVQFAQAVVYAAQIVEGDRERGGVGRTAAAHVDRAFEELSRSLLVAETVVHLSEVVENVLDQLAVGRA